MFATLGQIAETRSVTSHFIHKTEYLCLCHTERVEQKPQIQTIYLCLLDENRCMSSLCAAITVRKTPIFWSLTRLKAQHGSSLLKKKFVLCVYDSVTPDALKDMYLMWKTFRKDYMKIDTHIKIKSISLFFCLNLKCFWIITPLETLSSQGGHNST